MGYQVGSCSRPMSKFQTLLGLLSGQGWGKGIMCSQARSHILCLQSSPQFTLLTLGLYCSVLTIELENFEAQMLSGSGKVHGLLYSAQQRFKALINYSFFYSCNKYLLIIYYVPFTGITEVNPQSGRQAQCISTFFMPQPIVKVTLYDITLRCYSAN